MHMDNITLRIRILNVLEDAISDFLYYDRKEDDVLPRRAIQQAVRDGVVTVDELAEKARSVLKSNLSV